MSKFLIGLAAAGILALISFATPASAAPKADGARNTVEQVNLSARRYHRRYHHRRYYRPYYYGWPYGGYPYYRRYYYRPYAYPYYRPYYRPYWYGGPFAPIGFGVRMWW
jgi:hypothetical protein